MSFSDVYIFSQWIFWEEIEECTYEIEGNLDVLDGIF